MALQLLSQVEHKVAPELLDLAAQYVPDMRLLKNVRNEFIVFRDRIFSGDGKQLNLNETDLFAMMLYKSTHLADFETIRLGHSKLDILYKVSRELVTENIKRFESERRVLLQQIARINGAATRSTRLGERLLAHVQRTVQAAAYRPQRATYFYAGKSKSPDDLRERSSGQVSSRQTATRRFNGVMTSVRRCRSVVTILKIRLVIRWTPRVGTTRIVRL